MTDLKPCPFCGSSDVELQGCDEVWNVCCEMCQAGYWTDGAKDAGSIWNARVSPWRSLKDDPPANGTNFLVRNNAEPDEHTDYNVGLFIGDTMVTRSGTGIDCYVQWMEVPE